MGNGESMEPLRADDPRTAGEFRLRARLGAGGMGRVYLGMSPAGRAVAVKVVHPELARDTEFVTRFRSEVAAAQAVNGIYTAQVVDAGLYDNPPWLATAYIPGPTLDQLVGERGPLPEAALWRLAAGLAEALRAVHAAGLVHRDLKPTNVLLAEDGPRVIDFGVSRALDGTSATKTGLTFGTPPFMSPEQARGLPAGPASDVFSLGCVMCFAATGQAPFGDGNALTVLYRIVHERPAIDGMPGGLHDLAARCLAKDPASRPGLAELTASLAARTEEWDGSFWPGNVLAAIRGYRGGDLPSVQPAPGPSRAGSTPGAGTTSVSAASGPAITSAAGGPATTRPPVPVPPTPVPVVRASDSPAMPGRRRLLVMAGGLGGVVVAGAVAGWDLSRPGAKSAGKRTGTSGVQRDTAVTQAKTPAGTIIWTTSAGSDQFAVGADVVAVTYGTNKVVAQDAATGAHRWTWSGPGVELLEAQGNTVIVTAWDGPFRIIGIDAGSGKQLWASDTGSETPRLAIADGLAVAPATGNIGAVSAYELSTGTVSWTFGFPGHPAKWPAYIAAVDGDFYVADSTDKIWHVSASGDMLAQFTAQAGNPYPLAVTDGVLCGLGNGIRYEGPQRLYALDAVSGAKLWDSPLNNKAGNTVVAAEGTVFVAGTTGDGGRSAIMTWNARSGAPGWHHDWPGSTAAGAPLATAPGSLLTGIRQTLCAFSAATGVSQWQITLDGDITTIVVSGTVAYVGTVIRIGTGSSRLYAIQL